jgi:hypothetical protein
MRERQIDSLCNESPSESVQVRELKGAKLSATFGKPVKLTAWLRLFYRLVLVFLNTSRGYVVQFVARKNGCSSGAEVNKSEIDSRESCLRGMIK